MQLGKLGSIIAEKLVGKDNNIFYITTEFAVKPKLNDNIQIIKTVGVQNLLDTIKKVLMENRIDFFIHAMAVSDYTVEYVTSSKLLGDYISKSNDEPEKAILENKNIIDNSKKISSNEENLIIKLKKAPKIISEIKKISPNTKLIGFKLLNNVSEEELKNNCLNLLIKNDCILVIGNDSKSFVNGNHEAIFVNQTGIIDRANNKEEIADKLKKYIKQ